MEHIDLQVKKGKGKGGGDEKEFIMTILTTGAAETFTLPCGDLGIYAASVDWGDSSAASHVTTFNDSGFSHVYADAGSYTITVTGDMPWVYFGSNATMAVKVITVEQLGQGVQNLYEGFKGCTKLTDFTIGANGAALTGDNYGMFYSAGTTPPNFNMDLTGLDASGITGLVFAFFVGKPANPLDLSPFAGNDGANLSSMVRSCYSVTEVDVTNLVNSKTAVMLSMFRSARNVISIVGMDTWDVRGLVFANDTNFMLQAKMTTPQYDAVLIAWAAQEPPPYNINFGDSKYTAGGAAHAARNHLVDDLGWTIADAGT